MDKHEIRQNKTTREWVIFAPTRAKRPKDFRQDDAGGRLVPQHDERCPFCPGNEGLLPGVLVELPGPGGGGWQTRVVPNKFPALVPEGGTARQTAGLYITMDGHGRHEVIVESPRHDQDVPTMSREAVDVMVETYHRRYVDVMREHQNMLALLFRNHGARAGTSLIHPHSQLIVTGFVPHFIRWREEEAQRYYDEWGRCVFCDVLDFELREGRRLVMENAHFVTFVPFAAEVPFEMWLMPKRHQADFGTINDGEKEALARMLREALKRLCNQLNDPDYNYIINTSARYKADEPQLHWYLQIRPRLTTRAGFEIGSGISINPSLPERDAAFLAEA